MTDVTIFVFGAFVTLLVCGTLGRLWSAAIEDGRYNREYQERQPDYRAPNSNDTQNVQ
jgi:hypothetical protein